MAALPRPGHPFPVPVLLSWRSAEVGRGVPAGDLRPSNYTSPVGRAIMRRA